jgi:hypothetical protein
MEEGYAPTNPLFSRGTFSWPSREVREAYEAALVELFKEYPYRAWYHSREARSEALIYARSGNLHLSRRFAIEGGIPPERLNILEALLL